ncbi:MAG: hypothetical protein HOY71_01705 [Nonomuraea sp.]|nr:hypothetical protein [Nonomuraea sp.]
MSDDRADIQISEPISSSLNQWDTMSTDLSEALPAILQRIRALNSTNPQGNGGDGRAFDRQYLAKGGPERFLRDTENLVKEISGSGPLLRTTVSNTLSTEQAIQAAMTPRYIQA